MHNNYIQLKLKIKSIIGFWQSNVWLIKGRNSQLNATFSIIFIGSTIQKNYIVSLFFTDSFEEKDLGKKNIIQIKRLLSKNPTNASYFIAEGLLVHLKWLRNASSFFLPQWIDSEIDIPLTPKSQGAKSDFRKIKKNSLSYQISNCDDDVEYFYHQMYLPYLKNRYQGQDIPMDYEQFKAGYYNKTVEILFVIHEGIKIAGQIIDYSSSTPRLWSVGVLNSEKKYLSMACISACYVFASNYLAEKKYHRMHVGKSRPIINDGALQFKIKWGTKITSSLAKGFLINQLTNQYENITFFESTPFIYVENNSLNSAVVSSNFHLQTEDEKKEIIKRNLYMLPGVDKLNVFNSFDRTQRITQISNLE